MNELIQKIDLLAEKKATFELLKAKFETENSALLQEIDVLSKEITVEVLEKSETVSTEKMSVIYCKGKTTWDGKLLEGYAVAHPEILAAKKIGKPTVSFRPVKK